MRLWIVRDKSGLLYLHDNKPTFDGEYWIGKVRGHIDFEYFPEVTFENSPQEVELKLVNN